MSGAVRRGEESKPNKIRNLSREECRKNMKIEEWILNELESLEMNQSVSRPQYITYRAGMIYEILMNVDLDINDKDKLLTRANALFMEYLPKCNLS